MDTLYPNTLLADTISMKLLLIFLYLNTTMAADFLSGSAIDAIENSEDVEKLNVGIFQDINSTYKGQKKNCGYVNFPEENESLFGPMGKYTRLKHFYDLKREVKGLEHSKDPENDIEFVRRKKEFTSATDGTKRLYDEVLSRLGDIEIRTQGMKDILKDYKSFEKNIVNIGEGGSIIAPNESSEVFRRISKAKISFDRELDEFHRAHDHYFSYGDGVLKTAKKAKRDYPRRKSHLKDLYKDEELMALAKEFPENKLEEIFRSKEDFKRSKNLTIIFEGTGQYSPILEKNIKVLQSSLGINPSQEEIQKATNKAQKISNDNGYFAGHNDIPTWSGTIRGPIAKGLYAKKKNSNNLRGGQWLYLPSENSDFTGMGQNLVSGNDMVLRKEAFSRGFECLKKYLKKYPDTNLSIVGHSSGVKAAIDFTDRLKENGINAKPDILGIDPVNDMIKGGIEGAISGSIVSLIGLGEDLEAACTPGSAPYEREKYNGAIMSEEKDALTKPKNSGIFKAFYQTQDREGLGVQGFLKFGIHGSPIKGGDNKKLSFSNSLNQHHGAITQEEPVLDAFRHVVSH